MSNDRFRFRVWDEADKKYYPASDFCVEDLQESGDGIIVEQCTGLRDKNGKLVYEGDIVHQTVGGLTCRIVFYRGAFCGEFVGGFTSPLSGWFRPDFDEVIGNIHQKERK